MGCDIHCYIEYKTKDRDSWSDFGGRINPGRNYWMFGAMAGVRNYAQLPFIEPRGVPDDLGYASRDDWTIFVSDSQVESTDDSGGSYTYSRAHAEEHVAKGYCQYFGDGRDGEKPCFVTNSDWHSASWHTADEFEMTLAVYLKKGGFQINTPRLPSHHDLSNDAALSTEDDDNRNSTLSAITEYWAILQAMRCFEAQGHQSRLVFWFDN